MENMQNPHNSPSSPAVVRVRGLPEDKTLAKSLVHKIIDERRNETSTYQVSIVPSCERHGENEALVDFDTFPDFLSGLRHDALASWQVHVDGKDLSFDKHFIGFTQLYEPTEPTEADIVAICGLDGHGYGSWQGRGNLRRMWLRHFLSKDLPSCRTMIYGYNTKLARRNFSTMEDYVIEFMEASKIIRGKEIAQRPIIFIAHSFGGLILARAIVKAKQEGMQPAMSTILGLLFFAVPHRGLDIEDMSRIMETEQHPRLGLLQDLDVNSEALKHQLQDFIDIVEATQIVSFYETEQSRRLQRDASGNWKRCGEYFTSLAPSNAVLQLPSHKETRIPIQEDHSKIIKFDSNTDRGYHFSVSHLKSWLTGNIVNSMRKMAIVEDSSNQLPTIKSRYMIPLLENRHFVGRESKLAELQQKYFANDRIRQLAIFGLGGVGKTQLALAFCYAVKKEHPDYSIFWLSALSGARFKQDYTKLAKKCSLPTDVDEDDLIEQVQDDLSGEEAGKWLLVVDNVDDKALADNSIINSLPQAETGITLFTTRYKEIAVDLAEGNILSLEEMNLEEAEIFFAKSLGSEPQDPGAVKELLGELTCLPLAIAQAASYIHKCSIPISKYLALMKDTEEEMIKLLSRDFWDSTRKTRNAIAVTWLVSFERIKKEEPAAADILYFLAFLENKTIPLKILPPMGSEGDLFHALGILTGYSFLSENGKMYDMHRLVHRAIRIWMQKEGVIQQWKDKTISHLADIFPWGDWENRSLWREFIPHAIRVLQSTEQMAMSKRADLCFKLGRCLKEDGRTTEAIGWIRECVLWREKSLSEDHPDRLASQHTLAMAYESNGQVKEAIEMLEKVVAIEAGVLAEDHPDRLESQHALAIAYKSNGQAKEAIEMLEKVVTIRTRVLAEDHPNQLASQHALAIAYESNGQVKEAIEMLEKVVTIRTRVLAEDHPDRLASQHELASAYRSNGQVKEAIEMLEKVVAIEAGVLAEDHPDRLASQHALAIAYKSNGQAKEAIEMLEKVVAIEAGVLAEDHPSRLASQHVLAMAYNSNGQVKEAIEMLERVVMIRTRVLAEDHPNRLASQHVLASAYSSNRQVKEAIEMLERVVTIRTRVLAEDHPDQLASQHALALAYSSNGQIKEAIEMLEKVVTIRTRVLAEDHPSRLASQHVLAMAYESNGQVKEAIEMLEKVVAIQRVLAEDHPSRLASQHVLALAYVSNGQVKEAIEMLEKVVTIRTRVLAEDHPDRLASQHALAIAYVSNGQVKEAIEMLEKVVAIKAELLAEDHPSRLASQHVLAMAYRSDGQADKAISLMQYVATIRQKSLRVDHPSRILSEKRLSEMLSERNARNLSEGEVQQSDGESIAGI